MRLDFCQRCHRPEMVDATDLCLACTMELNPEFAQEVERVRSEIWPEDHSPEKKREGPLTKKSYNEKVDDFIRQRGPFTYEGWATFSLEHGFKSYPLEPPEIPQQACQACGSTRPQAFQLLTDRFGALVIIGRDCERKLQAKKVITHHSED